MDNQRRLLAEALEKGGVAVAKTATKDKVMAAATKTVNVVECSKCGEMHLICLHEPDE